MDIQRADKTVKNCSVQTDAKAVCALAAKTDPENACLWLPLVVHLEDTACVMEYLLEKWLPEHYSECLGLSREEFFILASKAALCHDVGKSTKLFQWMITAQRPELRDRLRRYGLETEFEQQPGNIPHAAAGAELLRCHGYGDSLAAIVGAHHGAPEEWRAVDFCEERPKEFGWDPRGKRNTGWGSVQDALFDWISAQTETAVPECSMTAQMALTGLVIMADWIASNTAYFPLIPLEEMPQTYDQSRAENALRKLRLPKPWRVSADWQSEDYFVRRFGFAANRVQEQAERIAAEMQTPGVMILEAPMGQGKTEAAMSAAEILMNRFHLGGAAFFLPSQATSNAMFTRMTQWAEHQPDAKEVAVELVHGQAELNPDFLKLSEGRVQIGQGEHQADPLMVHSFFCGRKTRLLANLVIGTIDQLLMAALKQKHVMLRHLGLTGKVVIVDECHAYDTYMNTYLDRVLNWLGAYHIPVILLSATLPGKRRSELLYAYLGKSKADNPEIEASQSYPLICWTAGETACMEPIPPEGGTRSVKIQKVDEAQAIEVAGEALEQGCVGVIVNTVGRAQTLRELFRNCCPEAEILMDHSRFLTPDRLEHETEILRRVGKTSDGAQRRGVLVIGTQVLEQSLDLDFDLLITDLCPMDLLLQRIGRLHRHTRTRPFGLEQPRCLVMGAQGELDSGSCAVYQAYHLLRTRELLPEVIRLPEDISPLVQRAYDPALWSPEPSEAYEEARQACLLAEGKQKQYAKVYRLRKPSRNKRYTASNTIQGLLDKTPGLTELQAQAAVRDGNAAIEVLVVQQAEAGFVTLLSGAQKGTLYRMDTQPSAEEARVIAAQLLCLPSFFSKSYRANAVIEELEKNAGQLPLWTQAPYLEGALFLILDCGGTAELAGKQLQYDSQIGLIERRETDGRNCV